MKSLLIPVVCASIAAMLLASGLISSSGEPSSQVTDAESAAPTEADLVVTVLGSGTPVPSATQFGPTILVQAAGQNLMFDCGRGCTTRLAQLDPKLISKLDRLFITHLHSDHIVGIDDLWLNGWTQGRLQPLKTIGPEGTQDMMKYLRKAYGFDINSRFTDGVPGTLTGLDEDIIELVEDGVVYSQDGVEVTAFIVDHSTVKPAWGYRVDYNGRSVMISGDTGPAENLYVYGAGADIILQEVMSPALIEYLETIFDEQQTARVVAYHTTAEQAADIFTKTAPRLAVYYHTRNDGKFAQSLLDITRQGYDGALEISHDLFQIRVGDDITVHDLRKPEFIGR